MPTSDHHSGSQCLQPLSPPVIDRRQLQGYAELEGTRFTPSKAIHLYPLTLKQSPAAHIAGPAITPETSPAVKPLEAEPLEPIEPCASLDGRFGSSLLARSKLSPSQRAAAQRRTEPAQRPSELALRCTAYVTYTVEPR